MELDVPDAAGFDCQFCTVAVHPGFNMICANRRLLYGLCAQVFKQIYAIDKINYLIDKGAKITLMSSKTELTGFLQSLPPRFEQLVKAIRRKI